LGGDSEALQQIALALLDNGKDIPGYAELRVSLEGIEATEQAQEAAAMLLTERRAVFVFEQDVLSAQAARLIANIAALSAHTDGATSGGIVQIRSSANAQGLIDLGIQSGEALRSALHSGSIRGLVLFGEQIDGLDLHGVEFLAVQDWCMSEAARQADVVLPAAAFAEKQGSYTAGDNIERVLRKAAEGPDMWSHMQQICALCGQAGAPAPYETPEDIRRAMSGGGEPENSAQTVRLTAIQTDAPLCRIQAT